MQNTYTLFDYLFIIFHSFMFHYILNSKPSFHIDENIIDKIFKNISNNIQEVQNGTLNIIFMDDDSIQLLNKNHRWIDKSTDVLSFHYYDDFSELEQHEIAWEIVLSEAKIIQQAKEYKLWTEKEFYKLLIHSILHILWYDHEQDHDYEIMQAKETLIWSEVFEK